MFPDSQEDYKQRPPEAFATVIRHLLQNTNLHVYLCGHGRRAQAGQAIIEALGDDPITSARVHNWMGQTTLLGILELIAQSTFVMCNDSFALHAANAAKTPVLCIALQTNLGRYLPYPEPLRASPHYYVFGDLNAQRISDIPTAPVIALELDQLCQAQGVMALENAR